MVATEFTAVILSALREFERTDAVQRIDRQLSRHLDSALVGIKDRRTVERALRENVKSAFRLPEFSRSQVSRMERLIERDPRMSRIIERKARAVLEKDNRRYSFTKFIQDAGMAGITMAIDNGLVIPVNLIRVILARMAHGSKKVGKVVARRNRPRR